MSDRQASRLSIYFEIRKDYLRDHPNCGVQDCRELARDIHHTRGKHGKFLFDVRFFLGVCRRHHDWIHQNVAEARKKGLIGPWMREDLDPREGSV